MRAESGPRRAARSAGPCGVSKSPHPRYASFFYLKNFPFDYLKIDGEFIRGLSANPVDRLVVQAIAGLARGMGMKTVAEFVGDADTARLLVEGGVDYAQGYHVGPPRPATETDSPL